MCTTDEVFNARKLFRRRLDHKAQKTFQKSVVADDFNRDTTSSPMFADEDKDELEETFETEG